MATKLAYLDDFDVVQSDATVVSVGATEDGRVDVQLDGTCFYPRGGGQDWDEGMIIARLGATRFAVNEVRLDETGTVHHIGAYAAGEFHPGDTVQCAVDEARRSINTRLHSAGHVVDKAVGTLGLDWIPGKGAHYPHMSFVEYAADVDAAECERLQGEIERATDDIVEAGSRNEVRFMPVTEMHTVCKHVPDNIPTNKPARVMMYGPDFGIPCGGTHVKDVHDIGKIHVTKVKSKKGVTKVSYSVEGIN